VNKAEGMRPEAGAEFHELGLGEPMMVSASHGDGVRDLVEHALAPFMEEAGEGAEGDAEASAPGKRVKVAVVGRPNVGKSTLINTLLGEERLIAFDQPGTTRDSIEVEFDFQGQPFTLIDTAGIRRKGKVFEAVEKFSVVKTLQSIADANVVVLLLDAASEIADQDAHIAGFVLESGRALVVAVNKWDGLDEYQRDRIKREIDRKLHFLRWARVHHISALKKTGLGALMRSVVEAHKAAFAKLATPKLTRALIAAVARQQPARSGNTRPKLRYAHQGGQNPPVIVIHGNSLAHVSDSYRRYLESQFREQFDLTGTPLRVEFRTSRNPYAD
jgi:GTP-binding protein